MLLTTAAVMKHQHMVEEKQVTTQMNPHAFEPCPFKNVIKAPPGTYQISNLLGSDQPISRQAGKGSSVSHKLLRWTETGRTDGTDGSTRTSSASSSQHLCAPTPSLLPCYQCSCRPRVLIANRFNQPCETALVTNLCAANEALRQVLMGDCAS